MDPTQELAQFEPDPEGVGSLEPAAPPPTAPEDDKRWLDVRAERGWPRPTGPRAYGGGGLSKAEAKVLAEEMAKLRLRPPLTGFGLSMIGPLLLQEGSDELRREHLPPIVRGEI